jgi:N-acyl-phosphatidylethanolamine-hydrolysing phospholipase D
MKNIGCTPSQVTELDWRETRNLTLKRSRVDDEGEGRDEVLKVTALECQHFTGRGIMDRNESLWASWSVENLGRGGGKVWFAGECTLLPRPLFPFLPGFLVNLNRKRLQIE